MNKIRLYLLLALPFVSCKSAEIKLGKELLPLEQTKTIVTLDEYIEEIGYIRPDTTRFLYSKKILTRKNGDLITGDRDGNLIMLHANGQFKRVLARYGIGHQEYINLTDMALSKNTDYLLVLDMMKIRVYGIEDSLYYKEINLSSVIAVDEIAPADDGNLFLYAAYSSNSNSKTDDYLVTKIDQNGDVIDQFMKRDDHTFSLDNITQSYGNTYYLRPQNANHIFYKFDTTLTPMYQINFGDRNIPYQYKYKSKDNDIGEFMNSDYYKLPIYLYETENLLYFSAAGPQAEKCNYLYFKDKLEGINWTDSNDEPVISLIASDASYLYFMYNGIYSSYFDAENPMNNSPLYRYISDVFIHEWKLSINDDVIVKIKFKEKS